ncbi:MAG: DNA-protecting protein DprA [Elusimicrobia bacterium CG_4_10_14_0_2_um_filter_56_8]|nr:MAG: DNA protecting protein DprA [Elusimicrobia bacterium CG1_02_56_21]PJA12669.1 MAG: DNA-protecting protein DprA [Elusimicrobia bacterium CG_4_10_14_0_2_um_filter_56_8]
MGANKEEEKLARVRLNFFACYKSDWLLRLIGLHGGAADLLKLSPSEIAAEGGVMPETAQRLAAQTAAADPEKEMLAAEKAGVSVLTALDEGYPELLKNIYDPPLVLYVRGKLAPVPAAAIVGTRKATAYGLRTAARLARELAESGVAVASGLARGIDTAAHKAAVEARGCTWAALGSGLNDIYPGENRKLAERIVETGGALVSEFPMNKGPLPSNFPRRNRIISGLTLATVVVEGGFESGALITARFALDQGREVLAVPGPVDSPVSRGPNYFIKNGAAPVENSGDIVACFPPEYLFGIRTAASEPVKSPSEAALKGVSPDALEAYRVIEASDAGLSADELTAKLAWQVQRAAAALFELETSSLLISRGGRFNAV